MKILKEVIDHANSTLEEIEEYVKEAFVLRAEHKNLADSYVKIAEQHVNIFNTLHEKMIMLVEDEKSKNSNIPEVMKEMWKEEHNEVIEEFAKVKFMIEEYKKMGY